MSWKPKKGVKRGVIVDIRDSKFTDSGVSVDIREKGMPDNWAVSFDRDDFDFDPVVDMEVEFELYRYVLGDDEKAPFDDAYKIVDIRENGVVEGHLVESPHLKETIGEKWTNEAIEAVQPRLFTDRELKGRTVEVGDVLRTRLESRITPYNEPK